MRLQIDDFVAEFPVLVDTGAERSLFDGIHVRAAGRDIFSGNAETYHGFLGASTTAYEHRVFLQIEGVDLEVTLSFTTAPISRQVLGRDVLEHFVLGLREKHLELYLAPESR